MTCWWDEGVLERGEGVGDGGREDGGVRIIISGRANESY